MSSTTQYDIAIIGRGPAGSTFATLDQDCGYGFNHIYGHLPARLNKVATVTG